MQRHRTSHSGFSLIEIAIAIGITAFTLSTLVGIFSVSSQSTQDASRDTLLTSMIGQVMGDLRSLPFDVLWQASPRSVTQKYLTDLSTNPVPASPGGTPQPTDYYFSSEGVLLPNDTTGSHKDALYHCQVLKTVDSTTQSFGASANPATNRLQLTLRFDWPTPLVGTGSGPNVKLAYESVARYF